MPGHLTPACAFSRLLLPVAAIIMKAAHLGIPMRKVVAVAMLVALTGSLAGCLDDDGAAFFSAMDGRAQAEAEATGADETATLVGVAGVETAEDLSDSGFEGLQELIDALVPRQDDTLGDGLLGAWLYSFRTDGSDELHHVVVDAVDGVTHDFQAGADGIGLLNAVGEPIGAWEIDSDAATRSAEGDAEWVEALDGGPLGVGYALAQYNGSDASVWSAYAMADNGSEEHDARVVVDGVDGSLLDTDASDFFSEARYTRASRDAAINNLSPTREADFQVKPELKQIWLDLSWTGQAPTDMISAAFVDPDGNSIDTFEMASGDNVLKHYMTPVPGDWVLHMELQQGSIGGTYDLVWCMATEHYDEKPCVD